MINSNPLRKEDINNFYKFIAKETISKEFFLNKKNLKNMKVDNSKKFSNTVIAMYDMSQEANFDGKSVILDLKDGIFISNKTTKRLLNEYTRDSDWMDLFLVRTVMELNNITKGIPMITGVDVYFPLSGTINKNSDWISMNWISEYRLKDNKATFKTNLDFDFEFAFRGKNLTAKIYDTCLIGHQINEVIIKTVSSMGYSIINKFERGLLDEFKYPDCITCSLKPQITVKNINNKKEISILSRLHDSQELSPRFKSENIKTWQRDLNRKKRFW